MANSKISALTSATTPLAGTETVPIVQSGATKKAAVTDLTNGIAITPTSITTTGTNGSSNTIGFQMTGAANQDYRFALPGVADWRLRGNYGSGNLDVVLNGTVLGGFTLGGNFHFSGNATVDTAAKGINFTANTPAAGKTSQLLNWYEEGGWTPGFASWTTAPSIQSARYVRIGRQVTLNVIGVGGVCAAGSSITGLPFSSAGDGSSSLIATTSNNVLGFYGVIFTSTSSITNISTTALTGVYWAFSTTYFV